MGTPPNLSSASRGPSLSRSFQPSRHKAGHTGLPDTPTSAEALEASFSEAIHSRSAFPRSESLRGSFPTAVAALSLPEHPSTSPPPADELALPLLCLSASAGEGGNDVTLFLCQVTLLPQFSPPSSGALPQGPLQGLPPLEPRRPRALGVHRARRQVVRPRSTSESYKKGGCRGTAWDRGPGLGFPAQYLAIPVVRWGHPSLADPDQVGPPSGVWGEGIGARGCTNRVGSRGQCGARGSGDSGIFRNCLAEAGRSQARPRVQSTSSSRTSLPHPCAGPPASLHSQGSSTHSLLLDRAAQAKARE